MFDVLSSPDEFFRRQASDPGFRGPVVVVLLAGISAALSGGVTASLVTKAMPSNASFVGSIVLVTSTVGALVVIFALWLVYAVVLYAISIAFDGEGGFTDTFKLVGWGYVPSILGGVVSAVAMYTVVQGVTPPHDPQSIQPFVQQLRSRPAFQVASLLGVVFTLWQGFIWTFAIKHARRLGLREAAITVAIPVGLSVVWSLYNLVG